MLSLSMSGWGKWLNFMLLGVLVHLDCYGHVYIQSTGVQTRSMNAELCISSKNTKVVF